MNYFRNILWGIVLITLGIIIGLNSFEITNIDIFFDGWWTLFIIVPCFIDLFKKGDRTGNIIGLTVGILLLLSCQDLLKFEVVFKLLLPLILIIIGLSFIFKNMINNKITKKIEELNKNKSDKSNYTVTFAAEKHSIAKEKFEGSVINAIFGGIDLDLKNAKIEKDAVINVTTIFGGVDLFLPDDVNIIVNSTSIFGGVENHKKDNSGKYTIYVNAICIFGGVDIK